ncbi:MAG TPA: SGNH/GDSL hydrolase family protein [Dongiaceae bacterium]|nr:SGNH/GDSL hydrolase family protein [Dongiaceae bacterium]
MPTVLCYGDSNTYGTMPMTSREAEGRYPVDRRWTAVLGRELGAGWTVVVEGLPGRTTVHDDPIEGAHKNGGRYLLPCLQSHRPLDAVVLMLGTNDLKARFSLPAEDIADGIGALLEIVAGAAAGSAGRTPRILLVAPPPLARLDMFAGMFTGGTEKSLRLAGLYAALAARRGVEFLDTSQVIRSSDVDGIHFDADALEPLGQVIAGRLRQMLG